MKNKVKVLVLAVTLILAILLSGCTISVPDELAYDWKCSDMASDSKTATDYYRLDLTEKGIFDMYDASAGNPALRGEIQGIEVKKDSADDYVCTGSMSIKFDTVDFDPPLCWDLNETDSLDYALTESGELKVTYDGVTLTFTK